MRYADKAFSKWYHHWFSNCLPLCLRKPKAAHGGCGGRNQGTENVRLLSSLAARIFQTRFCLK